MQRGRAAPVPAGGAQRGIQHQHHRRAGPRRLHPAPAKLQVGRQGAELAVLPRAAVCGVSCMDQMQRVHRPVRRALGANRREQDAAQGKQADLPGRS
eukprot:747543-Hanusia_phi.AAC.1